MLEIRNLHVSIEGKEVVKGLNLTVKKGEVHAMMGPNGSGKSSLVQAIMGHPKYEITRGDVLLDGESVLRLKPNERAKKGLFLAFQYPYEVPGVGLANFLRVAYNSVKKPDGEKNTLDRSSEFKRLHEFQKILKEKMGLLSVPEEFLKRNLNEGFSGGEKKRAEILQMAVLSPKIAILDETDSGLDIDSLKQVSNAVNALQGPNLGILLVTHYQRILKYVEPKFVHVMIDGKIALSGGSELAAELEEKGYDWVKTRLNATVG